MGEVMEMVNAEVFSVWFLIGAALVFWMQAGFAMVETGFTRAKNTGNILMKNLMDFCIGCCVFILIGFGLLLGEDQVLVNGELIGPQLIRDATHHGQIRDREQQHKPQGGGCKAQHGESPQTFLRRTSESMVQPMIQDAQ